MRLMIVNGRGGQRRTLAVDGFAARVRSRLRTLTMKEK
jgi:hypothetical protein